ncbi:MAG: hypothetical protein PVH58_13390, partial [Desulfobacterales bacterium]
FKSHFVYPAGKPMPPHLRSLSALGGLPIDCGPADSRDSFTLGRLEAGAPSTFAHLVVPFVR